MVVAGAWVLRDRAASPGIQMRLEHITEKNVRARRLLDLDHASAASDLVMLALPGGIVAGCPSGAEP